MAVLSEEIIVSSLPPVAAEISFAEPVSRERWRPWSHVLQRHCALRVVSKLGE